MKGYKHGYSTNTMLLAGVIVLALLFLGGVLKLPGAAAGTTVSGSGSSGNVIVLPSSQGLTVNPVNMATPQVAVAANSNVYDNASNLLKSQLASGTSMNVPALETIHVFTNSSGYFSSDDYVTTGTQSTIAFSPQLAQVALPTVTIYNPNSYTVNSFSAMQAFSGSSQYTFQINVGGATNEYLADPKVNQIYFDLAFTTPSQWAYSSSTQTTMMAGNTPCTTIATQVTGGNRQIAWSCPISNGGFGTAPYTYYLTLSAAGSHSGQQNTTLTVWNVGKYQNTQTGAVSIGAENNLGSQLYLYQNTTIFTN